jgi:hypothetical protein
MSRKVIRSSRIAKELIAKGFVIIDIAQDRHDSKRTVFVFEDSRELKDCLDKLLSKEV